MNEQVMLNRKLHVLEPKQFYRAIEQIFQKLETAGPPERFAKAFLSAFFEHLAAPLNVSAIHLYDRLGGRTVLQFSWGDSIAAICEQLDGHLNPISDPPWIGTINDRSVAIIRAREDTNLLMVFFADADLSYEPDFNSYFSSAFSSLDYALSQNLKRLELQNVFEQARAIQMSLLPSRNPDFAGFDISAITLPAAQVGGDVFDFQYPDQTTLAITIADAAGYGLPAALQARDVITAIRMGIATGLEMTEMIERLNQIIHQSGLVTRFVSTIFGLLSSDGKFSYVNAGHPRPWLLRVGGDFEELDAAGVILGPQPDYAYSCRTIDIPEGAALVLFTDGVIERTDGSEFGIERLKMWMEDWQGAPASMAVQAILHQLHDFGNGKPFTDDVTLIYISRFA